jgi:hypothetical protein
MMNESHAHHHLSVISFFGIAVVFASRRYIIDIVTSLWNSHCSDLTGKNSKKQKQQQQRDSSSDEKRTLTRVNSTDGSGVFYPPLPKQILDILQ